MIICVPPCVYRDRIETTFTQHRDPIKIDTPEMLVEARINKMAEILQSFKDRHRLLGYLQEIIDDNEHE